MASFALPTYLLTRDIWAAPGERIASGGGDTNLFMWFLGWAAGSAAHLRNPLFSDFQNYPRGINLMWNTSILLPGLLVSPVTLGAGLLPAYNLLVFAGFFGAAVAAFALARSLGLSTLASLGAGLVYGFSPFLNGQSRGHLHLTLGAVWVPWIGIGVLRLLRRSAAGGGLRNRGALAAGSLIGLLVFAELMTSEELLAVSALFAAIGLGVAAGLNPVRARALLPTFAAGTGAMMLVFLVLAAIPLGVEFGGPQRITGPVQGGVAGAITYSNDLLQLVIPNDLQQLRGAWTERIAARFSGIGVEQNGYLGAPLLAVLGIGSWRLRRLPWVPPLAAVAVAALVLSLGPVLQVGGHRTHLRLPFRALMLLPLFDDVLPGRLALYAFLSGGLILAATIDRLAGAGRRGRIAAGAVALACLVPLVPFQPFPFDRPSAPAYFDRQAVSDFGPGAPVLLLPYVSPTEAQTLYWAARTGPELKVMGAYALVPGPEPRTASFTGTPTAAGVLWAEIANPPSGGARPAPDLILAVKRELDSAHVRGVILGPVAEPVRERAIAAIGEVVGAAPEARPGGVLIWRLTG